VIDCHPVGDAPAAVVPDDGEALGAERFHCLDEIGGQRPLAVGGVVWRRRRPERPAVAG
jgi:hypothetical protein